MEYNFTQGPLPLGLSHLAACSSHEAQLCSRTFPTGTRPPCSLLLPWSTASLKGHSHWDLATLQLVPPMEHSFAQRPPPLGLRSRASSTGTWPPCILLPQVAQLRLRASPTGTRPPCSLLFPWSTALLKGLSHWDSTTLQLAPSMEHSFAQGPLPLGLCHLASCSSHGVQLRSRASPTGTRPPCSFLLPWSTALLKGLPHWDSTTLQLSPPMEHSFAQGPPTLGLGHLAACSSHGAQLRSTASSTRTSLKGLPHWDLATLHLALPISTASPKGLPHWDSTTLQLAPPMEHSFAQGPPPLGLGHLAASFSYVVQLRLRASPTGTRSPCSLFLSWSKLCSRASPLGLGHLVACSSHRAHLCSRTSPTGTRPPCSLLLSWSTAPPKGLPHWDSATLHFAPPMEHSSAEGPLLLGLGHLAACSSRGAQLCSRASPTGTRPPCSLLLP
ncbi:hypothetical protein Adt_07065 [Abeliophyllum distichum]|uniref:Uncharacterized protein n=1 Tax=Abeliophyllum distichum TaxID=126358 RepID=A0ABD1V8P4_9LAMI